MVLFCKLTKKIRKFQISEICAQAENAVHDVFSAEAAEPLNMVGMGESPCYDVMLLFDCGRSRTSGMY